MATVAIISEYNPFHTGHKYHFEKIREELGSDTRIISVMSGNYTQRGDVAIMDKFLRAECAVRAGANLVLELPFPFSISSAELFAHSGVSIASRISVVDYLSFGSESGNIEELIKAAENMLADEYKKELDRLVRSEISSGYPALREKAYKALYNSQTAKPLFTANNILALEYIKEIIKQNSRITPHTIQRFGANYCEESITENPHQSATAIRSIMNCDINSALNFVPNETKSTILSAFENREFPTDSDKLSSAVISHFRLDSSLDNEHTHDSDGGLYNRLKNISFKVNQISQLTELAGTKKYTQARIKRAIWCSYFGVTSSEIKKAPEYSQVLAMDSVGKNILREIKKKSCFPILTKPSAFSALSCEARMQKKRADSADSIFQLTKPKFTHGDDSLTKTPFILV